MQRGQHPLAGALALLTAASEGRGVPHIPSDASALIQLILDRHHVFTRDELTRLEPLSAKVLRVHKERAPELVRVDALLGALRDDLLPHMDKEERVLFPYIQQLAAGVAGAPPFGNIEHPLSVMNAEHEHVGALLGELAAVTDGYTPPTFACASFRALYDGLRKLQADIHEHVHLENHVHFPLGERLEATRRSA